MQVIVYKTLPSYHLNTINITLIEIERQYACLQFSYKMVCK